MLRSRSVPKIQIHICPPCPIWSPGIWREPLELLTKLGQCSHPAGAPNPAGEGRDPSEGSSMFQDLHEGTGWCSWAPPRAAPESPWGVPMFHVPSEGSSQSWGPSRGSSMSQDPPGISSTFHIPTGGQPHVAPWGNSVSQGPPKGSPKFHVGAAAIPGLPQDESRSRLQPRASMSLLMWEIIRSHSSSSEGTDCSSELLAAPVPLEAEAAPRERR